MAELPRDLSFDELKNIVKKAFLAEPLGKLGVQGEVSPYQGCWADPTLLIMQDSRFLQN